MGTVMQKNYRCPGCGVTLEFDPATQKLHCAYCEASYSVAEIEKALQELAAKLEQIGINTAEPEKPAEEQKEEKSAEDMYRDMRETMQMTILHCNACGAVQLRSQTLLRTVLSQATAELTSTFTEHSLN